MGVLVGVSVTNAHIACAVGASVVKANIPPSAAPAAAFPAAFPAAGAAAGVEQSGGHIGSGAGLFPFGGPPGGAFDTTGTPPGGLLDITGGAFASTAPGGGLAAVGAAVGATVMHDLWASVIENFGTGQFLHAG